ncbi:hypothetical protein OIE69_44410 (plasmid) [Actinacidiphila glaucinigra]|uniref:hypothetical protein n=1 Tax=Actinacidiphila glaucinigra TaxID=235986 RepID=UPI002DDA6A76|nr:hypothetical protein [Actinacidiphila glaucinigra]WSD65763.1 hypothetical protein OIE69_43440 [Actinacidiphila glaucinigra]WSD65949.1 hypothetical protein OIE69_44410 [Actinacidiphila glaucinigra]
MSRTRASRPWRVALCTSTAVPLVTVYSVQHLGPARLPLLITGGVVLAAALLAGALLPAADGRPRRLRGLLLAALPAVAFVLPLVRGTNYTSVLMVSASVVIYSLCMTAKLEVRNGRASRTAGDSRG